MSSDELNSCVESMSVSEPITADASTTNDTAANATAGKNGNGDNSDFVSPWEVATASAKGIDYDKLIGMCYKLSWHLGPDLPVPFFLFFFSKIYKTRWLNQLIF